MKRRDFLQHTAALVGVSALPFTASAAGQPRRRLTRIGLELYSVRDEMARDPERTLAAVAKAGYQDVELLWSFGNFGRSTAQVRTALNNAGLKASSAHLSAAAVLVGWQRSLDIAHTLGHQYLIVPVFTPDTTRSLDDWREWADRFNEAGEQARKAGLWLAFHNEPGHLTPLDGQVPYDVFLERTNPAAVRMQLDVGNMAMGGADPLEYLTRHGDRYWSFHLKDVVADGSRDTALGRGRLPLARLLGAISQIDDKPCFVEQESATDQLAAAAADLAYLRALEF